MFIFFMCVYTCNFLLLQNKYTKTQTSNTFPILFGFKLLQWHFLSFLKLDFILETHLINAYLSILHYFVILVHL